MRFERICRLKMDARRGEFLYSGRGTHTPLPDLK